MEKHKVWYLINESGDEWLIRNIDEQDEEDWVTKYEVVVEEIPFGTTVKIQKVGEPTAGDIVYCNGLGVVKILEICNNWGEELTLVWRKTNGI